MNVTIDARVAVTEQDDGGLLLISEHTGMIYQCSPTAAKMWRALGEHGDIDRVASEIADHYGITPQRAQTDLDTFVADLVDRGLAHVDETGKGGRR